MFGLVLAHALSFALELIRTAIFIRTTIVTRVHFLLYLFKNDVVLLLIAGILRAAFKLLVAASARVKTAF